MYGSIASAICAGTEQVCKWRKVGYVLYMVNSVHTISITHS